MKCALWSEDEFFHKISQVPLQKLNWRLAQQKQIEVWVRRDDLLDPQLSGNKFYKLYYNLVAAKDQHFPTLVSFGGAYSNHLHALAAAGHKFGFKTIGIVRGDASTPLSPTLIDAQSWGMKLYFVSRQDFRQKDSEDFNQYVLARIQREEGELFLIPEGGANRLGVKGAHALGRNLQVLANQDYTAVCLACGTGTTFAGVVGGLEDKLTAIGFSALKGEGDLGANVETQISQQNQYQNQERQNRWRLISGFHGGGYAKKLPIYLSHFLNDFETQTHLQLDPVYTTKLCWGVSQLLLQDYWPRFSKIILIHSGGLQGRRGFDLPIV